MEFLKFLQIVQIIIGTLMAIVLFGVVILLGRILWYLGDFIKKINLNKNKNK